ncbi:MAG TPA: hypothetical protein VGD55_09495 [Acidothermaceae bacterium]
MNPGSRVSGAGAVLALLPLVGTTGCKGVVDPIPSAFAASEQRAYHGGLLGRFVEEVGATDPGCDPGSVMGYFDGNTVTALWNYARSTTP